MQHDLVRSPFDLDLMPKLKLTFRGHRIYSSIRLDEPNTMVLCYCHTYKNKKVICDEIFRSKTAIFYFGDL